MHTSRCHIVDLPFEFAGSPSNSGDEVKLKTPSKQLLYRPPLLCPPARSLRFPLLEYPCGCFVPPPIYRMSWPAPQSCGSGQWAIDVSLPLGQVAAAGRHFISPTATSAPPVLPWVFRSRQPTAVRCGDGLLGYGLQHTQPRLLLHGLQIQPRFQCHACQHLSLYENRDRSDGTCYKTYIPSFARPSHPSTSSENLPGGDRELV